MVNAEHGSSSLRFAVRSHAKTPYWYSLAPVASFLMNSPRFALQLGFFAKAARFPQLEVFLVARRTVDYMLPLLVVLNVLEPRRSNCEVIQNLCSGAAAPFRVGVRSRHSFLVLAL